jgi:hypothetical protein
MNQNQCQAGEFVPDPVTGLPVFQGYTVNKPTKLSTYNNVIWVDDLGGITSGIPGFWAVDPHDFDDVEGLPQEGVRRRDPRAGPGPDLRRHAEGAERLRRANFEIGKLSGNVGLRVIETELTVKQNLTGDTRNYGDTNADAGDRSPSASTPTGCRR